MNWFDLRTIHCINHFSQRWPFADEAIDVISSNMLFTGTIFMAVLWWAWFRRNRKGEDREVVIAGLVLSAAAIFAARALALLLPFRARPLWTPSLHFIPPSGVNQTELIRWSSFPSDHAAMTFALCTTIFFLSRRLGILAFLYAAFVVNLPRVYLGFHFPTDIIAGAAIGIALASLTLNARVRRLLSAPALRFEERMPGVFYCCFFIVAFLFGTMFDPLRQIAVNAMHGARHIIHHLG